MQCIDEIDNTLLAAKPITYTDTFPVFLTLDEHIKFLTGIKIIEVGKLISNIAFMKLKDWSYEKEWHLHRPHESNAGEYNDRVEDPRVFGAIYMGCRISDDDKNDLITLIQANYSHMEIYQAKPSTNGFKIEYVQIQ